MKSVVMWLTPKFKGQNKVQDKVEGILYRVRSEVMDCGEVKDDGVDHMTSEVTV